MNDQGKSRLLDSVDEDSLLDQVIDDRYHILSKLGSGGVGVVYRAEHVKLGREVAVKVLQREYASKRPLLRRFEREARAMATLSHPGIVTVTDFGVWKDLPFIVMELLEGQTLKDRITSGRLGSKEFLDTSHQILKAVAYAHDQGLVHRDIKPANVFLKKQHNGTVTVCILDFGLAKFVTSNEDSGGTPKLTVTGVAFGTPKYMSPEQACGGTTDQRTDLYSIGVMLFEMLTGKPPFSGETAELMRQHLIVPPPKVAMSYPYHQVSPALEAVFERALAKDRLKRFRGASEMLDALEAQRRNITELLDSVVENEGTAVTLFDQASAQTLAPDSNKQPPEDEVPARNSEANTSGELPSKRAANLIAADRLEEPSLSRDRGFVSAKPPWLSQETRDSVSEPLEKLRVTQRWGLTIGAAIATLNVMLFAVIIAVWGFGTRAQLQQAVAGQPVYPPPVVQPLAEPFPSAPSTPPPAETETHGGETPTQLPSEQPTENELWDAQTPSFLAEAKVRLDSGRQISESTVRQLRRYLWENRSDPRPLILLARYRMKRNHRPDAIDRYWRAFNADPRARQDPQALHDLIELSTHRTLGWKAAQLVTNHYGAEAIPAIDQALADPDLDSQERQQLRQLRQDLGGESW